VNHCIISGLPTNNKFRGNYIHPDVIDLAMNLVGEQGGKLEDAFRYLSLALAESTLQRLEAGEVPDADV